MKYFSKKRFTMRQVVGLLTFVFLGISVFTYAAVTLPYPDFVAGNPISSDQVDANFTALKTAVDALEAEVNIGLPCNAGFTRVGPWCLDTDGAFTELRGTTTSEASYTLNLVSPSAKMAIIKSHIWLSKSAAGVAYLHGSLLPGDSPSTAYGWNVSGTEAMAALAGEYSTDTAEFIVKTDVSGQVKTRCNVEGLGAGTSSIQCFWYIVGYMD